MYSSETIRLKAVPLPAYFLIVMAILFSLVGLTITYDRSTFITSIIMGVVSVFVWVLIRRREIIIDPEGLTYRNLFSTERVEWSDVLKIYARFYHRGKASSYFFHFVTTDQRTVKFSVRFFRRKQLRVLAQEVIANTKSVEVDKLVSDMAEGVFPWRILW